MIDVCLRVQNTCVVSGQRLAHLYTSLVLVAEDLHTLAHCDVVAAAVVVVGLEAVAGGGGHASTRAVCRCSCFMMKRWVSLAFEESKIKTVLLQGL